MQHHVARVRDKRLAFLTWEEGVRLFQTVVRATPGLVALCVMPDHVHVLCPGDVRARLGVALGGFARWRNRRRGESGPVWEPLPDPEALAGKTKIRRNIRYIHLNPCRAGLVDDPLAWPLSSHMDAVGLCVRPVRRKVLDPARLHAYVSGDPTVRVAGTELPCGNLAEPSVQEVLDAVSVAARVPLARLRRRREPTRELAVRACRALTPASRGEIAAALRLTVRTVNRAPTHVDAQVRTIERWLGDRRCTPLDDSVLHAIIRDSRYRRHRA